MLLTVRAALRPGSDLGFLLHKNPAAAHRRELAFGVAHVVWPEVADDHAMAALILEIDPIALVRGRAAGADGPLDQYVNDRPYSATSFLSVALAQVFREALAGRSKERQALADAAMPLELHLPVVPVRGGERFLRALFEPLGWAVEARRLPRDPETPSLGESSLHSVTLRGTARLADALCQLYVLVPVLDDDKHYWVGDDEVDKLVARGEGWLEDHPEKEAIALRYLARRRTLAGRALRRLVGDAAEAEEPPADVPSRESELERPLSLQETRIATVAERLVALGAKTVADLGCGEGQLVARLARDRRFTKVIGMDVSASALERAVRKLKLDRDPGAFGDRVALVHGALGWRDDRLDGLDAACLIEVIEHVDPGRLPAVEAALFGSNRPRHVLVSTPNAEYNALFPNLPAGRFRHADHRFEWDRATFRAWCDGVCARRGYAVEYEGIGAFDAALGPPTQLAVFTQVER